MDFKLVLQPSSSTVWTLSAEEMMAADQDTWSPPPICWSTFCLLFKNSWANLLPSIVAEELYMVSAINELESAEFGGKVMKISNKSSLETVGYKLVILDLAHTKKSSLMAWAFTAETVCLLAETERNNWGVVFETEVGIVVVVAAFFTTGAEACFLLVTVVQAGPSSLGTELAMAWANEVLGELTLAAACLALARSASSLWISAKVLVTGTLEADPQVDGKATGVFSALTAF